MDNQFNSLNHPPRRHSQPRRQRRRPPWTSPAAPAAPISEPGHNLKGPFEATVLFNKPLHQKFYRLGLQFTGPGAEAFAKTRPGQFAQFDVSNIALPAPETIPDDLKDAATKQILLRRPFSFARVAKEVIPPAHPVAGPDSYRQTPRPLPVQVK